MADLVTLAEALQYLARDEDDDGLIAALVTNATAFVRDFCGRTFEAVSGQVERIDGGQENLVVGDFPITAITSVIDKSDDSTLVATDYDFDPDNGMIFLVSAGLATGALWGAGRRRWEVTYDGGAAAPAAVKQATLALVAERWRRRDASAVGSVVADTEASFSVDAIAPAVRAMLDGHRDLAL